MAAERPVVGIVGHHYIVTKYFGDLDVVGTAAPYVDQVRRAGGRPVVLPGGTAVHLFDVVDALVLTGGGDIDPHHYGGDPGSAVDVDETRDRDEIAVVRAASEAGVPVLGACRGMQVLVAAFGGTLTGDLGMSHVLPDVGHPVSTRPGSLIHDLLGPRPEVTSLHHQAAADPGPCWSPSAWADDGVVEAVEWAGCTDWPVLGVQWHPELEDAAGTALFSWLIRYADRRRGDAGTRYAALS